MQASRNGEQWVQRLEWNRRRLRELARRVGAVGMADGAVPRDDAREAPPAGDHADTASRVQEEASSQALLGILADNEDQINRAMARLRAGCYGVCEDCGERIPDERLRFRPEATRCVGCQARHEHLADTA